MRSWRLWKDGSGGQQQQQQSDNGTSSSQQQAAGGPISPAGAASDRRSSNSGNTSGTNSARDSTGTSQGFSGAGSRQQWGQRQGGGGLGMIQSLMDRAGGTQAAADAEMERKVSVAARNLGDGVQTIVMAARMGGGQAGGSSHGGGRSTGLLQQRDPDEWKNRLLLLLGGSDSEANSGSDEDVSDLDVLLTNAPCEKFVLRCVENELPPNLIHCLRLLRVLELQHAHSSSSPQSNPGPVSTVATAKVARLLCLLCADPSVGEQLRPHLFGLLALSGASYPPSGIHVASAASSVILAFSENCLSASLVWFLHDRKMIVHMTDDIKELCGMTAVSSPSSVTRCLYGEAAEHAGLWAVALRTVVNLVTHSCKYQCLELLKDFDAAGGYHVLSYAISKSTPEHLPKMLELVTTLVCCRTDSVPSSSPGTNDPPNQISQNNEDMDMDHVATNPNAFEIVEDLMVRSVPFLAAYVEANSGQRPDMSSEGSLSDLATFSVETAYRVRSPSATGVTATVGQNIDLARELLLSTLHLYSDHGKNYDLIESRYHILAHYLLAFPTFSDVNIKVPILKLLEYVCTGLVETNSTKPLAVVAEVFVALCKSILKAKCPGSSHGAANQMETLDALLKDAEMLCDTLEKLLQFDENVSRVIVDSGLFGSKLDEFMLLLNESLMQHAQNDGDADGENKGDNVIEFSAPPSSTGMDGAYAAMCRILRLVLGHPGTRTARYQKQSMSNAFPSGGSEQKESDDNSEGNNLNTLLTKGIRHLGDTASDAAFSVFEATMSATHDDMLRMDMDSVAELMDYFAFLTGRVFSVSHFAPQSPSSTIHKKGDVLPYSDANYTIKDAKKVWNALLRETKLMEMLRTVLETNESAQDLFRTSGCFECLTRMVLCLESVADPKLVDVDVSSRDIGGGNLRTDAIANVNGVGSDWVMKFLEAIFAVIAAATTSVRNQKNNFKNSVTDLSTSSLAMDLLSEGDENPSGASSPSSAPQIPSAANRFYLRTKGFYVEFSNAISNTGILRDQSHGWTVINFAFSLMEPSLKLPPLAHDSDAHKRSSGDAPKANNMSKNTFVRNPDACRVVLGLAVRLPSTPSGLSLAKRALDEILRLSGTDMAGSTLSQMASCGLCRSLTNPNEFALMLEDRSHPLYSRFVLLLRRIAAFSMTYMDFVALLRCIVGPILCADEDPLTDKVSGSMAAAKAKRVRLPVITSSGRSNTVSSKPTTNVSKSELWLSRESDFCNRLETLSIIAERGDRVARCVMGGDSLNTIALYMQKVPLKDRLYTLAEQGRIKFLEVESVDAGALAAAMTQGAAVEQGKAAPAAPTKTEVWAPLSSNGFTYSAWLRLPVAVDEISVVGNFFVLDISGPPAGPLVSSGGANFGAGQASSEFLSLWYDIEQQRFCVLSSSSSRNEPTCFPVSPLLSGVWHHILLTYQPPKRPMLSRKAILTLFVDGRPIEAEVKVESVNLPPTARVHIGAPNPVLASSGIVRGALPSWELGPTLLLSVMLGLRDATAMFTAGPDFQGMFWGDRPQRLSLTATATAAFAMLAESGEQGSVAGALRRRGVPEMEAAGHVMRERGFGAGAVAGPESDSLTAVGLLCNVSPSEVIFGFRAASSSSIMRDRSSSSNKRHFSRRLVNVARINSQNETVSSDAVVYGLGSVISPHCLADNVQWIGGPNVLMPIVNASQSSSTLAMALRLIRESVHRHPPNLEMLQAGGGYRILGLLLRQKRIMDSRVLDQCFAFAVHGFVPGSTEETHDPKQLLPPTKIPGIRGPSSPNANLPPTWAFSDRWVFSDLDAMKYLLLNHQVWDLRGSGPELPLRLLSFLNGLVAAHSAHAAFNSRRLHLLGIIRWTLHLMLEATELYSAGCSAAASQAKVSTGAVDAQLTQPTPSEDMRLSSSATTAAGLAALNNGWYVQSPSVSTTSVGGDPGNPLLLSCKTLLRRVLTYMLTPGDLEAIAGAAIYTVSITGGAALSTNDDPSQLHYPSQREEEGGHEDDEKLAPGPVARVYLLRLLEELVVDGVNEIVTASDGDSSPADGDGPTESNVQPHAGGGTSSNQSYLATSMLVRRRQQMSANDVTNHPKHQQAQAFLSAFAGILTPVWFACILEGCREEASASSVLRLMILMLQSSPTFAHAFEEAGGFAPLVLSIPKFSTCPSITMSMLSQLLNAPILHLPCFATLDASQLCEVFDSESDSTELIMNESIQGGLHTPSDPSCGIFALLAECLGRNIQLASFKNELGRKARQTNEAVLQLLSHRHTFSSSFQEFCRTPDFLEPLAQALCLVHDEKLQRMQQTKGNKNQHDQANSHNYNATDQSDHNRRQMMMMQGGQDSMMGLGNEVTDDFMSWPSAGGQGVSRMKRRGSLCDVQTDETPTERFVGKADDEGEGSGIGMVQLLHLVLSHAVFKGPLAAPLVSALFRSFPIHASPDQVEAFHLVLIEHCRSVAEDALQRGEPIALANCIGVTSVLLDRLMAGFFTSEPVLEAVKIAISTLGCLTATGTYASRTLGNADQNMLIADIAHLSRLMCLTALQRSRPMGPYDEGDDDLKLAVLDAIGKNLRQLLLIPASVAGGGGQGRRQGGGAGSVFPPPAPGSRFYPLWQSASLARCCPPSVSCTYPDLAAVEEPDRAFVVALMAEIHIMLLDKRRDIREQAVVIVVSLLQQRRGFMSELLITDIPRGDNRMETVDLMNRGGFGALLVAHEAATIAENISTVPRRRSGSNRSSGSGGMSVGKLKYASFFEWLERNQAQVAAVFHGIHIQASRLLPGVDVGAATPEEAIENEQKVMLLKLTSQDSSDRTILGGLERAELAQRSHDKTAESHALWKRQGFDDLSSGAMQWKFLLRQLKGSCSIWEGGYCRGEEGIFFSCTVLMSSLSKRKFLCNKDSEKKDQNTGDKDSSKDKNSPSAMEIVTRWKLDLTEGYERQRRRLLPNYEFHSLYNLDETVDIAAEDELVRSSDDAEVDQVQELESASSLGASNIEHVTSGRASVLSSHPNLVQSETNDEGEAQQRRGSAQKRGTLFVPGADSMEATAALLKEMKLGKAIGDDEDDDDVLDNEEGEEELGDADMLQGGTLSRREGKTENDDSMDKLSRPGMDTASSGELNHKTESSDLNDGGSKPVNENSGEPGGQEDENSPRDNVLASSYDLITGLLETGDWPEKSYNVKRCTGLEVRQALLLWCRNAIYIVDGFEQTDGEGLEGKINRLEKSTATFYINLRPEGFTSTDTTEEGNGQDGDLVAQHERDGADTEKNKNKEKSTASSDEITYQHRSQRVAFSDLYSVYRRRYQLQQNALEFYDVHRNGTLIAFANNAEREEVLGKVLRSPLPNSIFSSNALSGASINYKKFMNSLRAKITTQWVQGRMTNFDFIMQLNSFAGRSYNDLTQYPVFPWILADYDSEEIDLNDPSVYRDLSKPMGAQGETRAAQFRERYEALESNYFNEDEPPPFHYGTHYSCAAYVLYYLMRLEPFSRLALTLQGGRFDVADRLFHNIGASWRSASTENLQDVRELIPEFFYLPDFLVNKNMFDFGTTQLGKTVHDVTLPRWAKGDPERFVRIHRQALESDYVSKNLHFWVDLVFGYKQRGKEAVAALNTFVHVTYEGQVDLDTIEDPIQRESTIAQIQNFGQTPSRLERKPFPQRNVVVALKEKSIDFNALHGLAPLTPPFCVVGAPHRVYLKVAMWDTCRVGMAGQVDSSVGDMCLMKGQIVGVGRTCALILPAKKYYRYGGPNNGVSVHVAVGGYRENRVLSIHDGMHRAPISVLKPSLNGHWLVTGCTDSTVRVWKYDGKNMHLRATLCGHDNGKITCIDISTTFGTVVTGGADGNVLVWDLRTLTFMRKLRLPTPKLDEETAAVSVSINHKNGNIMTLVGSQICLFDINGNLVAKQQPDDEFTSQHRPSCAVATDCPEWMENGIVAVTGHVNGDLRFWSINYDDHVLVMRHLMPDKVHSCPITALRVISDNQNTLLVGDKSGKMSVCKTLSLDALNPQELSVILHELRTGCISGEMKYTDRSKATSADNARGLIGMTF